MINLNVLTHPPTITQNPELVCNVQVDVITFDRNVFTISAEKSHVDSLSGWLGKPVHERPLGKSTSASFLIPKDFSLEICSLK